jgi:hypothetical protein
VRVDPDLKRNGCDVAGDDLALGVCEHAGLRQRLAERERDRDRLWHVGKVLLEQSRLHTKL